MSNNAQGGRGGRTGTNQPTQAGRFKPKRKVQSKSTVARTPTPIAPGRIVLGRGRRGGSGDRASQRGGRDGRGGRGRGRGRGRFVAPKGKVFFTGEDVEDKNNADKNRDINAQMAEPSKENTGIILMPGGSSSAPSVKRGSTDSYGNSAQDRIVAASLSRQGEGDEEIVGELESSIGSGNRKKPSLLDSNSGFGDMPSKFDDHEEDEPIIMDQSAYQFDSDSSADGQERQHGQASRIYRGNPSHKILQPQQLPIPPPRKPGSKQINYLYECQKQNVEKNLAKTEVKSENAPDYCNHTNDEQIAANIRYESPFIANFQHSTPEQQREELQSWIIFKFPTRLPRLNPNSTLSGRVMKRESGIQGDIDLDMMGNGIDMTSIPIPESALSMNTSLSNNQTSNNPDIPSTIRGSISSSYDDTLKDAASGRYGKIIIHQSGKSFLLIGDGDGQPIQMQLSEGLPCSFLQQAVAINSEKSTPLSMSIHDRGEGSEGSYTTLGEVRKSLVVTPDIESVFPMY